jgi:DNA-binding SARP family transcriptional activator
MFDLARNSDSEQPVQPESVRYDLKLFGEFRLMRDGVTMATLRARSRQLLFAYLAINAGKVIDRSYLAGILWPDSTEQQARTNLRHVLHSIRRTMPDYHFLVTDTGTTLTWRADAACIADVSGFLWSLDRAEKAGNQEAELHELQRALARYAGELLPGHQNDWVLQERDRLARLYLAALERAAHLLASRRDYPAALEYCSLLVAADPLRETAYQRLMRLHALDGNRASVEQTYQTCVSVLDRELDIGPSHQTRDLYQALIKGAVQSRWLDGPSAQQMPAFVGRQSQWARLGKLWNEVDVGHHSRMVLLSGEAGIGKTRLAEEFLHHLDRQGVTTLGARCYSAEGELSFAPVVAWLRGEPIRSALPEIGEPWLAELARLLPELRSERPNTPQPPAGGEWQRQRLFEGLARAILISPGPIGLLIDDVQWCDRDTLEWLRFLLHFQSGSRLLLVATLRPEELTTDHPLLDLVISLQRDSQLTEIMLDPLDEAGTTSLMSSLAGAEVTVGQAQRIHRETEGNPLFIVEIMRAGQHSTEDEQDLPPTIQAVISGRLARLSPPALEIVRLAAVIGRTFNVAELTRVGSLDEDQLVDVLDELTQRRIVREHTGGDFDFTHHKLREVAYGQLGETRKRLLHRRMAGVLVNDSGSDLDSVVSRVAHHLERAGQPGQAAEYFLHAARQAQRVHANHEAERLYRRGLSHVPPGSPYASLTCRLLEGLGDMQILAGEHTAARESFMQAIDIYPGGDGSDVARLRHKLGQAWKAGGHFAEALAAYAEAEAELGDRSTNPGLWIDLQMDRMRVHYGKADWQSMMEIAETARSEIERCGTAWQRVGFIGNCLNMELRRNRYVVSDSALRDIQRAVSIAKESDDQSVLANAQFSLGFCTLWHGDHVQSIDELERALDLSRRLGDVGLQVLVLTYLAIAWRRLGRIDSTERHARDGLALAIGADMPTYVAAGNANLAWVAHRAGDVETSLRLGRAALEVWDSELVYPFQWLALWPLLDLTVARGDTNDALVLARQLLHESQQRLPGELEALFDAALVDSDAGSTLAQVISLARDLGYL